MNNGMENITERKTKVLIEYCGVCDYQGHCIALANAIRAKEPDVPVLCRRGRQGRKVVIFSLGSFEVIINDKLVYSKLKTMALPDYEEVVSVVHNASIGGEINEIKRQQPIECGIS